MTIVPVQQVGHALAATRGGCRTAAAVVLLGAVLLGTLLFGITACATAGWAPSPIAARSTKQTSPFS